MKQTKTLKVRVKDRHAAHLSRMARSVNFVWNYLNELSSRSIRERGLFLSAYDMDSYTQGAGKGLELHSQTLQEVSREYAIRRRQFRKSRLAWRKSCALRDPHGCGKCDGWLGTNIAFILLVDLYSASLGQRGINRRANANVRQ